MDELTVALQWMGRCVPQLSLAQLQRGQWLLQSLKLTVVRQRFLAALLQMAL
jgi:hypothetical protein